MLLLLAILQKYGIDCGDGGRRKYLDQECINKGTETIITYRYMVFCYNYSPLWLSILTTYIRLSERLYFIALLERE